MLKRLVILVTMGAIIACNDATAPTPIDLDLRVAGEMVDGRNGGSSGFYLLPPLAPTLTYTGVFDPNRSPIVEICILASGGQCGALAARFTLTTGEGSERLRVDSAGQLYIVQWRPREPEFSIGNTYRIRFRENGIELGHSDVKLIKSAADKKAVPSGVTGVGFWKHASDQVPY